MATNSPNFDLLCEDNTGDETTQEGNSSSSSSVLGNSSSSKSLIPKEHRACNEEEEAFNKSEKPYTLDDVLSQIPLGQFHWRILALVGSGYFAVCSEMMLFIFLSSPVTKEWNLGRYEFPWLPFSTGIAGITGGYLAGVCSDKFGRRIPYLVGMLLITIFGMTSAVAPSFPVFIILRCMVTAGNGIFESVGFVLLLEFLPRQKRGSILVVVTVCGALGAVYAGGMAWVLLPRWGWRWFVAACALPAVGVLVFQPLAFYETPRHLFVSGREEEGLWVLKEMTAINKCQMPQLDRIDCPVEDKSSRGNISRLFSQDLRWQTLVFSAVWFLQASGYWGVTMYLPEYMDKLGVDSYLNMFSVFIGEIPGLLLAMFLIEKKTLGRIGCLRVFSVLTALSLLVFSFIPKHVLKSVLIVLCYFAMVPIYSILNAFTPEVYPTDVRSTAMAWMNTVIEIPGLITPFVGATLLSSDLPWLYPVVWASVFVVLLLVTFGISFDSVGKNLKEASNNDSNGLEVVDGDLLVKNSNVI